MGLRERLLKNEFTDVNVKEAKKLKEQKQKELKEQKEKEEKEKARIKRINESIKDAKECSERVKKAAKDDMELKEFVLLRCYKYHITHTDSEISYAKYRNNIYSPENNLYSDSLWDDLPF